MKKTKILSLLLLLICIHINAQKTVSRDVLAPLPPMGWMTWNMFQGNISEQLIRETADAMVSTGLAAAGYRYIFIDDMWQGGRDNRNNIIPDKQKFPSGIKALADYVHSKGLKLGIYSDAAQLTCGGYTASYGFEEQDARTFASWGIDYLKYDYCNAPSDRTTAEERYRTMADALSASGRDILLGVCEWGQRNPEQWAPNIGGQVWRTSGDVRDMWRDVTHQGGMGILDIINVTALITSYAGNGHWPDMDMLVVGLGGKGGPSSDLGGKGCTDTEYKSQMSIWAMMASPLEISCDVRTMSKSTRSILMNSEVIAIDQDSLGKAAKRKVKTHDLQIFVRVLSDNRYAIAILNSADTEKHIKVDFSTLNLKGTYSIRDVWAHKVESRYAKGWKGLVATHQTKLFVLSKEK